MRANFIPRTSRTSRRTIPIATGNIEWRCMLTLIPIGAHVFRGVQKIRISRCRCGYVAIYVLSSRRTFVALGIPSAASPLRYRIFRPPPYHGRRGGIVITR